MRPPLTKDDRAYLKERIIAAYRSGARERELADRFSYSENSIYRIVRHAGVSRSCRAGRG